MLCNRCWEQQLLCPGSVKTTDYLLLRCLDFNIYTYTMSRRPGTDTCALKGAVPQLRVRVRWNESRGLTYARRVMLCMRVYYSACLCRYDIWIYMVISRPQVWRHFSGRDGTRVYMDAVAPSFFSWQGANGMGRKLSTQNPMFFFFCVDIYRLPCLIRSSTLFYFHLLSTAASVWLLPSSDLGSENWSPQLPWFIHQFPVNSGQNFG